MKDSALLNLNIIYDFGPRQCNQALPMPWHKLLSLESLRIGWVGKSLAAAFEI